MPSKKTKKNIYQPDDVFFKEVMTKPRNAKEYLRTLAPEWSEILDLDTLTLNKDSFTIPNLKTFTADVLYRCRFKDSDKELNISFLWENKSQPDKYISIQVGLYLLLAYYKMVKDDKKELEPIIPLFFYNGKQDWIPKTINELFEKHPYFPKIEPFLPNFDFHFTDITKVPEEYLLKIQTDFFRSAMFAMANRHDWNLLIQKFSVIFDFEEDNEDIVISIAHYVWGIVERLPENVKLDASKLDKKTQMNMKSTLAILTERGKVAGMAAGKIEGKIEGIEFTALLKDIEVIVACISSIPDFPVQKIMVITKRKETFIRKVSQGFKGRNEKKARKMLLELFKKFEIGRLENDKIDALLKEYLPKF